MAKLPKGITLRGSKYRVSIMVDGERKTGTADTLEAAMQLAHNIRHGLEDKSRSENWTPLQALKSYVEGHLLPGVYAEKTVLQYTNRIENFIKFFGTEKTLDEFTAKDFINYSAAMRRDRHMVPSTINGDLVILCTIMRHARKMGGMVKDIPEKPRFKQKQKEPRFLTREEEEMILKYFDHIGDQDMHDLVTVLIDTGMRVAAEALPLPARFIDLKNGTATIWKSKSASPRRVPLTDRCKAIFRRRLLAAGFTGESRSKVAANDPFHGIYYQLAFNKWQAMKRHLGQEHNREWTLHICRHTFATRLVSGGVDLRTVQVLAGHENIKTTMRYAHFVPDNMFKALEVLEGSPSPKLSVIK